jgi:DNA-binding NtrC family response regulator
MVTQAEGGTLFLDEVDSLSAKGQVTLLRFLQDQHYSPLGAHAQRTADVRVIAATNRPLAELVESGEFRQDLFFRLNIMMVQMPPLRERPEDITLLAEHFIRRYRAQYRQPRRRFHQDTLACLERMPWPGNVRALENLIHREFLLAEEDIIVIQQADNATTERRCGQLDRRQQLSVDSSFSGAKAATIADFEERYLRSVLRESNGNVTLAAKRAGKERRAFGKLLRKYNIYREQYE